MSMSKTRTILHFSKNILRDGTHFSNVTVKLNTGLATLVNGRKIIKAGTIVGVDGTKQNGLNAYGIVYEDVDCTDELKSYIFAPVVVHGIVEAGRLPEVPTQDAKNALRGIIFEAGPTKKADDFSSLEV